MTIDWDALAPDWANWHTTDSSGATWWENEPLFDPMYDRYMNTTGEYREINKRPQKAWKLPRPEASMKQQQPAPLRATQAQPDAGGEG